MTELGDLTRFDSPRQLAAFVGLIPSEYSSGGTRRQGGITQAGNGRARRALIEGMRYQLAWDHELCRAVVGVFVRAVLGFLRARARHDGVADGRGGAVAVIQRFGGALNLNVHVHALVLDGVFAKDGSGVVGFHPGPRLTALDVAEVLATVEPRIKRLLARRGLGDGDDEGGAPDAWADEAPVLAGLAAASVQGDRGARTSSWRSPSSSGGRARVGRGAQA